ncbi:hypothetical protein OESDEN_13029 [Oesophagostomum dentatum]|uniref:Uncharacterized protein n=1 Tax=Oesophagostomum dentatum TaxID=61180 RepID=A0A0B1STK5_OESDE|nr:hypothetical protein OESDEN_13029 [Oesophagostomum dentatum]
MQQGQAQTYIERGIVAIELDIQHRTLCNSGFLVVLDVAIFTSILVQDCMNIAIATAPLSPLVVRPAAATPVLT